MEFATLPGTFLDLTRCVTMPDPRPVRSHHYHRYTGTFGNGVSERICCAGCRGARHPQPARAALSLCRAARRGGVRGDGRRVVHDRDRRLAADPPGRRPAPHDFAAWLLTRTQPATPDRPRHRHVIAIDGKTLRGTRRAAAAKSTWSPRWTPASG